MCYKGPLPWIPAKRTLTIAGCGALNLALWQVDLARQLLDGLTVCRAFWEGLERTGIDCAESCLEYLKYVERYLSGSGDKVQKCELCWSGESTCDFASPLIIVINEIPKYKF